MTAMLDSSGNGWHGEYHDEIVGAEGLIEGDGSVALGPGAFNVAGFFACDPDLFEDDFTVFGVFDDNNSTPPLAGFSLLNAASASSLRIAITWFNDQDLDAFHFALFRAWDSGVSDNDTYQATSPALEPGPHRWCVRYIRSTNTATFFIDGAIVQTVDHLSSGPAFATPATQILALGGGFSGARHDEIALFDSALVNGDIGDLEDLLDDFDLFSDAILALSPIAYYHLDELEIPGTADLTAAPIVRLVTSRALATPHQVQRWVLPIICKEKVLVGPGEDIEQPQDVASVRSFFVSLRRTGQPVIFQEGDTRRTVVVRDVSFPEGQATRWGVGRNGLQGVLFVTVDSVED